MPPKMPRTEFIVALIVAPDDFGHPAPADSGQRIQATSGEVPQGGDHSHAKMLSAVPDAHASGTARFSGATRSSNTLEPFVSRKLAYEICRLAWPVLIAQLAVMAYAVIDTMMAGRFATDDLAAVGIGAPSARNLAFRHPGSVVKEEPSPHTRLR